MYYRSLLFLFFLEVGPEIREDLREVLMSSLESLTEKSLQNLLIQKNYVLESFDKEFLIPQYHHPNA